MNKYDIKFIIILIFIIVFILLITKNNNNYADVYYSNKLILKIDLNIDKEYNVEGYNGIVKLEVNNGNQNYIYVVKWDGLIKVVLCVCLIK